MRRSWYHFWHWCRDLSGVHRATLILEILTLAAVIIYAALTYCLLRAAQQEAGTADESMRVSNRPYVDIGRPDNNPIAEWIIDSSGRKTGLKVYFQNAGNTPAQRFYLNGGPKPEDFLHLTLKPVRPKIVASKFPLVIRPGEQVSMDATGLWSWVPGIPIPARSTMPVQANGFGEEQIASALRAGKGTIQVNGTFEYMDVFGEYCCEPYVISWDEGSKTFAYRPGMARQFFCPSDISNICRIKGEPILRPFTSNKKR